MTRQFQYWLLIDFIKCQRFKDSGSDKMEPKCLKYQQLDLRNNKEIEGLNKFESDDEGEGIGYIPLVFIVLPRKESNCPTDIGKQIKSLNQFICIPKIG